jgi:hypothetical protein
MNLFIFKYIYLDIRFAEVTFQCLETLSNEMPKIKFIKHQEQTSQNVSTLKSMEVKDITNISDSSWD